MHLYKETYRQGQHLCGRRKRANTALQCIEITQRVLATIFRSRSRNRNKSPPRSGFNNICMVTPLLQSLGRLLSSFGFAKAHCSTHRNTMLPSESHSNPRPPIILGKYKIIGVLGRGGNGMVYEGVLNNITHDARTVGNHRGAKDQRFAIKCSSPGDESSAAVLEVCIFLPNSTLV